MDKEFPHYVAMPIEMVMERPTEFIIPENIKAIEYLWNLNILTKMTNDYDNVYSWISFGVLSEENYQVLMRIEEMSTRNDYSKPGVLSGYGTGIRIPVKPGTKDTFDDFMELLKMFKPQDVQRDGYWTIDQFHSRFTGCVKIVDNPHKQYDNIEDYFAACREFDRKYGNNESLKIPVYDETQATKTLEEYLEEFGYAELYDPEEGRIYKNKRLFDSHMKYKEEFKRKGK